MDHRSSVDDLLWTLEGALGSQAQATSPKKTPIQAPQASIPGNASKSRIENVVRTTLSQGQLAVSSLLRRAQPPANRQPAWLALAGVTRDGDANWAAPFTRWHCGKRALRKNVLGLPMASRRIPAVSSLDRSEPMDETGFTLKCPSPSATSPSEWWLLERWAPFNRCSVVSPCSVTQPLDWYITRVRPVHEAICRWLILSWVFAHVVSQYDQISLRMSQATSLVTRSDLIVKSSNDREKTLAHSLSPALEADRTESYCCNKAEEHRSISSRIRPATRH
ncbi:hypothetical protein CSHISOI_08115 [Colletotrichum shisoi]|uniref:Uncharacterized protein n=1 Tax=Colletotrichum shisoi TaxID=2078593 RepID=A0A5Q4BKZ4_9PEZI|nr:hypothetical protein CSHISOI_08115 [Colletotrichum shisoi]